MLKDATVRARVPSQLKQEVEVILQDLGLSTSEAIDLFMHQIKLNRGLPFKVNIPNEMTRRTLDAADRGEDLIHAKDLDDLLKKLGI